MRVLFLASFFIISVLFVQEVKAQVDVVADSALTIDEVQQEVSLEVGEKIDEKNKELDQMIDERADKISNELTVKGLKLTESVSISAKRLTRLLEDSADYFDNLIEGGIASLNQGLDEERKALQSKADEDAGRLRNEVRDILIREIKEYSEQSEYVVKSFFFDAIFSETPICGIVEGLDLSTGWISLNTKMNFSPLNNQISTLKFSMAAILRHFRASESEHHATFSNINTAYRSGQLFCVSIYFQKDTITSWVEYSENDSVQN